MDTTEMCVELLVTQKKQVRKVTRYAIRGPGSAACVPTALGVFHLRAHAHAHNRHLTCLIRHGSHLTPLSRVPLPTSARSQYMHLLLHLSSSQIRRLF